jgi:hypothetical protein
MIYQKFVFPFVTRYETDQDFAENVMSWVRSCAQQVEDLLRRMPGCVSVCHPWMAGGVGEAVTVVRRPAELECSVQFLAHIEIAEVGKVEWIK